MQDLFSNVTGFLVDLGDIKVQRLLTDNAKKTHCQIKIGHVTWTRISIGFV